MRFLTRLFLAVVLLASINVPYVRAQTATGTTGTHTADATYPDKILACGYGNVDIYDITKGHPTLAWSFVTNASKGYTNCTPYNNNAQILATSVWTGIDVIDTASKTITAHWDAVCAHHAIWLPNNLIMLARSTCTTTDASGNSTNHYGGIDIFDGTKPGTAPIFSKSWGGSHYIVQNNDRDNTFWITNLPYFSLASVFNVNVGIPTVTINQTFNSPSYDANHILHAAARTPDGKAMLFATENNVYRFDLATHDVEPYQSTPITNAKSIDFDRNNGLMVYMSPDVNTPTTSGLRFGDGSQIDLPFPKYYRAFWYYGDLPASTATTTTTAATTNN